MGQYEVKPPARLSGTLTLRGDKSISHRAVMIGSIAHGTTTITNFAHNEDCLRTVEAFRQMGVQVAVNGNTVTVEGKGLRGLRKPQGPLYLGNSGTTMRLLLGILAGQSFDCTVTGDASLSARPMSRVTHPLRSMGARIEGRDDASFAPLTVHGSTLQPISYTTPIPSAQVKSCVLFAGLYADGRTCVTEQYTSRDHTERMLASFGADITVKGTSACVMGNPRLTARDIMVPGDISGASFFIVAATVVPDSSIEIRSVLGNPTRTGILSVLKQMGADIKLSKRGDAGCEPMFDILARSHPLKGVEIPPEVIPAVIDELPILMVAAATARGKTVIRGARELRVKETDRIHSMAVNLKRMGVPVTVDGNDITIQGVEELNAGNFESFGDHRTAMSMIIAALTAKEISTIDDIACIDTSFPDFLTILTQLKTN